LFFYILFIIITKTENIDFRFVLLRENKITNQKKKTKKKHGYLLFSN